MSALALTAAVAVGLPVLLFAALGVLFVTRGTPVERVRAPGDAHGPPAVGDAAFAPTVELLTKTALHHGHAVEIFGCGDELYPRLWEDIRRARRSLTLQFYYYQPGRMADDLLDLVLERAAAGVRVLFMRDAFGSAPMPASYWERLTDAGVQVAAFRPTSVWELHKVQQRSHIRVVVVDGCVGYTGGFGIDDRWFGDGRHPGQWRDTTVRFVGPAVLQLQATFAAGWAEATGGLLAGSQFFPLEDDGSAREARRPGEDVCAGLLHCAPTLGSTVVERFMALTIAAARRRLWISNSYFVPDDHFCAMLAEAVGRGVDVRVLTPDRHGDVPVTYWAGRARRERLLQSGVRLYEYTASMMHAKTLVVDGCWGSVGTNNFDNRSMAFNDESLLMIYDGDAARRLEELFAADLHFAREVRLEECRARPVTDRLREAGASMLSRVL